MIFKSYTIEGAWSASDGFDAICKVISYHFGKRLCNLWKIDRNVIKGLYIKYPKFNLAHISLDGLLLGKIQVLSMCDDMSGMFDAGGNLNIVESKVNINIYNERSVRRVIDEYFERNFKNIEIKRGHLHYD